MRLLLLRQFQIQLPAGGIGWLLAILLSVTIPTVSLANSNGLPELGESATQFLDANEEAQIGQRFLRELLATDSYIDDPELQFYLNQLGRKVGEQANLQDLKLHFNLLQDNELNAFAVPGGYITFNSGLLLTTQSESELASVIGHEIAHLSQRHLPRMIAKAEAQKLPTAAAIIAAILVGGQVGVAGVTLANANLISNQLAYSREFEREADAIGIKLMADSGFDPRAMSSFFDKLQRFTAVSSKDVPEFLRSHPLSYTRVAESEARIGNLPAKDHTSSFEFYLAQARIQALYTDRIEESVKILQQQFDNNTGAQRDAAAYGLALAHAAQRDFSAARAVIEPLAGKYPDSAQIQSSYARIQHQTGETELGLERFANLIESNPSQLFVNHAYLQTLLEAEKFDQAKKQARYLLRRSPERFEFYRYLSRANVGLQSLAEAHQADAEYAAAIGNYDRAIAALKLALRENAGNSQYLTQSVTSRLKSLEALSLQQKNREKT